MVRKQLYIEEQQEQALKSRARELGVTEAEIVRDALDRLLAEPATPRYAARVARERLLSELDSAFNDAAQVARPPENIRFSREDAYAEPRFTRWDEAPDER
jgi:DNA-binding FadR family transcriptional regulator